MSLDFDDINHFQKKLARTQGTTKRIKAVKSRRIPSYLLFSLLSPFFYLLYATISILGIFLGNGKKHVLAWYCRLYLKWYFTMRGVSYYATGIPKTPFEKPSLIFVPRYDYYSSLFVYQLFAFPVIIPLFKAFQKFRDNLLLPTTFIGNALKHVSYPDQNIDVCVSRVKALVKKGYTVVVHINQDSINTMYNNELYLSSVLDDLLKLDVDQYFLRIRGWEHFNSSTFLSPIPVSINLHKKEELIDEEERDNIVRQIGKIVEYFDFRYVTFENHD